MSLAGRGVLVTRPRALAPGLAARIEQAGGRAIVFPTIEIEDLPLPAELERLADFDAAIFVSPSAVWRVFRSLEQPWPAGVRTFAVGAGTRAALEAHAVPEVRTPVQGADSEALLALPELAELTGQRVLIVRGEGGRELIARTLAARGAKVEHAICYRRVRPETDAEPLIEAWTKGAVDAVTVFSAEGLKNLHAMLGARGVRCLHDTPVFVSHERIAAEAARLGLSALVAGASDDAMLERLVAYFS